MFNTLFKRWYLIDETAALLARELNEPVSPRDVLDYVNSGDLPAYVDATNRYALKVKLGRYAYDRPEEYPLFSFLQNPSLEQLEELRHGPEDFLQCGGTVQVLSGFYKVYVDDRPDAVVLAKDRDQALIDFAHGLLVIDPEDETIWKVVKRSEDAAAFSLSPSDFVREDIETVNGTLRIAAHDLKNLLTPPPSSDANDVNPESTRTSSKIRIQSEAARLWKESRKSGASPSKLALIPDLLSWCQLHNVMQTRGGRMTSDYLDRHVLRGWQPPD